MSASARTPKTGNANNGNTNRWSTRQLVTMALMCAISILLSFIEFVILPDAPFLKLDISLVPCAVVGFAYGPVSGFVVGIVCAVAHAAITGNPVGAIMNVVAAAAFILPAAAIYQRKRTWPGAVVALVVGTVVLVAGEVVANLLVDSTLYGMPFQAVVALVVPAFIPFNIIKGVVLSVLVALVYKSISNFITPAKDQVKGR